MNQSMQRRWPDLEISVPDYGLFEIIVAAEDILGAQSTMEAQRLCTVQSA